MFLIGYRANSIVLVSSSVDRLAVYDLYDGKKGAVTVDSHGQKFVLSPGSHLTLAASTALLFIVI